MIAPPSARSGVLGFPEKSSDLRRADFFPSLESRGYLLTMKFLAGTLVWFGLLSVVRAAELGLHYARNF